MSLPGGHASPGVPGTGAAIRGRGPFNPETILAAISSMTGYARAEGTGPGFAWSWELKSVNGKTLDLRFRLPTGFDGLEAPLKARASALLRRGSVSAGLTLVRQAAPAKLRVNHALLDELTALIRSIDPGIADRPRLDGLLGFRGVVETVEEEGDPTRDAAAQALVLAGFEDALATLLRMRAGEGARLHQVLAERLDEIATLLADAERAAAAQPAAIRARFERQLAELLGRTPPLPEERLAQEVALLIQRADIREELDRLKAHVAAARELLDEGAGIGRNLDFLCQEFNREANTVCSKAAELDLTRVGLALKSAVERLREQVQNIE